MKIPPLYSVAYPPHRHRGRTIPGLMAETLVALVPVAAMAALNFGMDAVRVMSLCMVTAVAVEIVSLKAMERDITSWDLSPLVTGLVFSMLLPASAPWWLAVTGTATSMILGRMIFGGLGGSPLCAPAVGWAVLMLSWPDLMDPNLSLLGYEFTAPLSQLKYFGGQTVSHIQWQTLLLGEQLGGLGAVQTGAALAGGLFLVLRRHIRLVVPLCFLAGVWITASIYHSIDQAAYAPPLFHLLAGGAVFGAFFLATEHSATPSRKLSMAAFGLLGGALVVIIRVYGIYPDGTPFAVLLANLMAPLLDRMEPRPWGRR